MEKRGDWLSIREVVSRGRACYLPESEEWLIDVEDEENFRITDETFLETFQVMGMGEP